MGLLSECAYIPSRGPERADRSCSKLAKNGFRNTASMRIPLRRIMNISGGGGKGNGRGDGDLQAQEINKGRKKVGGGGGGGEREKDKSEER